MHLQEITPLPAYAIKDLDDVGLLKVYLVQDFNHSVLMRLVNFELDVFGDLGMDEWGLVPQIRHGNVFVLKEENASKIRGIAILMRDWEDPDKCYLFDFAIEEQVRGQGLGTLFLLAVCESVREQGFRKMSLTVDTDNKPAVRLYSDKLGFDIEEYREDEYGRGRDRYIMVLDLRDIDEEMLSVSN